MRSEARVELVRLHEELARCRACPTMIGPPVHGLLVESPILLIGQAPGPREGSLGRPFAWTAGKTLFRWFEQSIGCSEQTFRERVYIAAVARCFPGKASGGGDRKPNAVEIERCKPYLAREVTLLQPELVIAVGTLAIAEVLGKQGKVALVELIGSSVRVRFHNVDTDVIALPHPSGASPWHKTEPGKTLLTKALACIAKHPAARRVFA
jgi:uracil-DNA glycosylase